MERVFIGLGSNLGDGKAILAAAWRRIGEEEGIVTVALSHPYSTAPVEMTSPHRFTNAVGELQTSLAPRQLLDMLMKIETLFGRTRNERSQGYEDRTLDLDMLYYGECSIDVPGLVLPHPRVAERLFVLRPLAEICPGMWSSAHLRTVGELEDSLVEQMVQGNIPLQDVVRRNWT
jgi:2-amino-4-hydroxy-6-hydroxymethyldihydropteridine diphosphokinase